MVSQIRQSEATTLGYSTDLQPTNTQVYDLEMWVKLMEKERNVLEAICFFIFFEFDYHNEATTRPHL